MPAVHLAVLDIARKLDQFFHAASPTEVGNRFTFSCSQGSPDPDSRLTMQVMHAQPVLIGGMNLDVQVGAASSPETPQQN